MQVFLLTCGDGSDGDEWHVLGIYATRKDAEEAQGRYRVGTRADGSTYFRASDIEEWVVGHDCWGMPKAAEGISKGDFVYLDADGMVRRSLPTLD